MQGQQQWHPGAGVLAGPSQPWAPLPDLEVWRDLPPGRRVVAVADRLRVPRREAEEGLPPLAELCARPRASAAQVWSRPESPSLGEELRGIGPHIRHAFQVITRLSETATLSCLKFPGRRGRVRPGSEILKTEVRSEPPSPPGGR